MKHKGFTLIELIIVMVLIGIIAVYATPRLGDISSTKAAAFRGKLRSDIRYAQNLAMTRNARYRVYFNIAPATNPGYAVTDSTPAVVQDPATGGNLSVTLNTGAYTGITSVASTVNPIEFNSLGKPTGGVTIVTVSPGPYTITVSAETGAVN